VKRRSAGSACFRSTGLFAQSHVPYPQDPVAAKPRTGGPFVQPVVFLTLIGYLLQKIGLPAYVDYSLASSFPRVRHPRAFPGRTRF